MAGALDVEQALGVMPGRFVWNLNIRVTLLQKTAMQPLRLPPLPSSTSSESNLEEPKNGTATPNAPFWQTVVPEQAVETNLVADRAAATTTTAAAAAVQDEVFRQRADTVVLEKNGDQPHIAHHQRPSRAPNSLLTGLLQSVQPSQPQSA